MLSVRASVALVLAAGLATFACERMGFAIVHSAAALALVGVLAPGFFVAFFDLVPSDWGSLVLSFVVNAAYYLAGCLLLMRSRRRAINVIRS